jgi:hypothetical protein
MRTRSKLAGAFAVTIILFSVLAPVIAYSQSVNIFFAYKDGYTKCNPPGGIVNNTNRAEYERCFASYKYPPVDIRGYASITYKLLSIGLGPYPRQVVVTQGNISILAYFRGDKLSAVEDIGLGNVTVNPTNIVHVQNVSFVETDFGFMNFTVVVKNIGTSPIVAGLGQLAKYGAGVAIQLPGYGNNYTSDGVTWIGGTYAPRTCAPSWLPGATCTVGYSISDNLPINKSFMYHVEVRGATAGKSFFYREGFQGQPPQRGVTPGWVNRFMGQVNNARGEVGLIENITLDRFAAVRFKTAVTHPDISDYGLTGDVSMFFGTSGSQPNIIEILLYPGGQAAFSYASTIQSYAPGHWSALTDKNYIHFGYYVGSGPYEFVKLPCSDTEIPRAGINITQFFTAKGCSVSLVQTTWLVLILGR